MPAPSSTIIEEISYHCKADPSCATAYFYFDFHNTDTTLLIVLRSLTKQLSLQCSNSIPDALAKLFLENAEGHRSPTPEALMSTIRSIIGNFRNVYIVFDTLDECLERAEMMALLTEIHNWELSTLHLLVTSRKERDIEESLKSLVSHQAPMDESVIDSDIRVYVSKTLNNDVKLKMCSLREKQMIEAALIDGARGM